jgi:hypothetical protein
MQQLDQLDQIAQGLRDGRDVGFWVLSSGERVYVALAADRPDLLKEDGYTLVQAWARLDWGWGDELTRRWRY